MVSFFFPERAQKKGLRSCVFRETGFLTMSEACLFVESSESSSTKQEDPSALTKRLTPKRLRTPQELEAGQLRADENRAKLFSDQSRRCAERVKKAMEVAKTAREELEATVKAKREMLDKQLRDAEIRRQKYLEASRQSARQHSEKVRDIASEHSRVRKTDMLRLCAQIQTQLWNAEARRCRRLAMRAKRASNLSLSKYSPPVSRNRSGDQEEIISKFEKEQNAASTIQFFWRFLHVQKKFRLLGLSVEDCLVDGFESTKLKIQRYEAVQAAGMTLRLLQPHAYLLSNDEARRLAKLFLTSFVIASHPEHVLDHPDSGLEKSIADSARSLLKCLINNKEDPFSCAMKARALWTKYRVQFDEWERNDRERLINGMIMDYVGLERLKYGVEERNISTDGSSRQQKDSAILAHSPTKSSSIWSSQIERRQGRLKKALVRIGGREVLQRLEEALNSTFSSDGDEQGNNSEVSMRENTLSKDKSKDSNSVMAESLLNEVYAHEMMIDLDTFLRKLETPRSYQQMLEIAKRAFRDQFRDLLNRALEEGAAKEQALMKERFGDLVQNLKMKLVSLLPQKSSADVDAVRSSLEYAFDMDLIAQMLNHDAFSSRDVKGLIQVVVDVLKHIQAPYQDEYVEKRCQAWLTQIDQVEQKIKQQNSLAGERTMYLISSLFSIVCEILDFIEETERSVIIAKVKILAPIVQEHGPEWERARFEEKIKHSLFDERLPITRSWLESSVRLMKEQFTTLNIQAVTTVGKSALENVIGAALVYLIEKPYSLPAEEIPEVLKLDHERNFNLQNDVQRLSLLAALDLILKRFMNDKIGVPLSCDLRSVNEVLKDNNTSMKDMEEHLFMCVYEALDDLDSNEVFLSDEEKDFLRRMLSKAARLEDPVFSILKRRILDSLRKQFLLSPNNVTDDFHLRSLGLAVIVEDFHSVVEQLRKISTHLVKVHSQRLMKLVSSILSGDE